MLAITKERKVETMASPVHLKKLYFNFFLVHLPIVKIRVVGKRIKAKLAEDLVNSTD